jgi:hypothetical protein
MSSYRFHAHLKEIEAWLETEKLHHFRSGTDIAFDYCGIRMIVRHEHKDGEKDETAILLPNDGIRYFIQCREFADERTIHFKKACEKLKSWYIDRKNHSRSLSAV